MIKSKIRVLIAEEFDPWFNLATEDWIFGDMEPETNVLFLWRNSETVVIGRYQNPWSECNLGAMKNDQVKLARRQSGGGAVYHDLGNTNFTFMSSKENYSKERNNEIIINALKKFEINAKASGRNDIVVTDEEGDKKISGSAFKEKKDRAFHHGTLLINADLTRLSNYLNPDKKKLVSKGVKSVRARVTNLVNLNNEISHDLLSKAIIEEFFKAYDKECEVEVLNYDTLKEIKTLNDYYQKLKSDQWTLGESPKFEYSFESRFEWGGVEVFLNSHKGQIKDIQIYSDSLHPEMISLLIESLQGVFFRPEDLKNSLEKLAKDYEMYKDYLQEFSEWVCKNSL